jgi:hypothetical protein
VTEGVTGGTVQITVTLAPVSGKTVTVHYATSSGTADAGSDFTSASGTLTFSPGQTSKTFNVSIFNDSGSLLARFGGGEKPGTPGDFFAPHDLCVDARGDLYVAEVTWSAGGNRGLVSPDCPSLQKLVRVNEQTGAT